MASLPTRKTLRTAIRHAGEEELAEDMASVTRIIRRTDMYSAKMTGSLIEKTVLMAENPAAMRRINHIEQQPPLPMDSARRLCLSVAHYFAMGRG